MRNIELKARLKDIEAARGIARELATSIPGVQEQIDTYFHCPQGRLKLREIVGITSQLVWYARSDEKEPKASDYHLTTVDRPEKMKKILASAMGIRAVVKKRREIFLIDYVRVHLDEVEGLGTFLEFEAVLGPDHSDADGHAALEKLREKFSITPADLLPCSYGEMV